MVKYVRKTKKFVTFDVKFTVNVDFNSSIEIIIMLLRGYDI